jgi:hypothetical protein
VDEKIGALLDALRASPGFGRFLVGEMLRSSDGASLLDDPPSAHRGNDMLGFHGLIHRGEW